MRRSDRGETNRKHLLLILLGVGILVAAVSHSLKRKALEEDSRPVTRDSSALITKQATIPPTIPVPPAPSSNELRRTDARRRLDFALAAFEGVGNASEARTILAELRRYLASLPPEIAAVGVSEFLSDPARDASTHIGFSVGKTGFLDSHPSLRVALLDWLGQMHPAQAGAVAEKILASPTHPDEWAVCLRNYARAYPDSENREFLRAKTEELIRNSEWRENPSVGFLEAFDVLVHTHATDSTALLGELVADQTPEGRALAHAAYLTLDRLTIREPVAMMERLAAQPKLIKVRGPMVANMFSRADLRDPEQRQLVRDYLLDPNRTANELSAFSGVYPNANFAISKNLLTETKTPTGEELAVHDAAVLKIVETWLKDPAFAPVKLYLSTMRQRLAAFVSQPSR